MNCIRKRTATLVAAAVLFVCVSAWGQDESGKLYTWTDKDGVTHVADSLDKVPKEYRPKTEQVEQTAPGTNVEVESKRPAPPRSPVQGGTNEAALKAQWQSRMRTAKSQLKNLENRYRQIEKRKSDLQSQWGSAGAALPTQDVLDEMNRLDADMASVKAEIDQAKDQINNVIPDEARKAGIPPGWLREVE